jgi:cytochrome c-type biogenesis protein CcmH
MKKVVWIGALLMAAAAFITTLAAAQQPTPSDDEVNRIAHQLYCPVCQNTPLDVCPTDACRQWRDLIRQQLSEGWTEDQIKAYFVQQYGVRVLAEPPTSGFNLLIYLLPVVVIGGGTFLLLRAMRGWRRPSAEKEPAASGEGTAGDPYVARLEDELRKRN